MKVLIIGGGGREHALAWKISQSPAVKKIYVAPGNGGTELDSNIENINISEIQDLIDFATKQKIDLTVVGPEAPLAIGIVDDFKKNNLAVNTYIGSKDISFQMYPDGIKSLTQGFTKNMAAGSIGLSKLRFLLLFTWFSGLVAAAWELPFAFIAWSQTGTPPSLYQYLLTIGFGIQFWWFIRKLGNFNFYLVLYPFMILYFLIVFFYSVSLTWRGKVIWKDRILDAKAGLK